MDQRESPGASPPDETVWDLLVEMVVPTAWSAALEQGLDSRDAGAVCDAAMLAVLDRFKSAAAATLRSPLKATVRDLALAECARIAALKRRQTIDLGAVEIPSMRRDPWVVGD